MIGCACQVLFPRHYFIFEFSFSIRKLLFVSKCTAGNAQFGRNITALSHRAGLWMAQQQTGGSEQHCLAVARALLTDCLTLLPDTHTSLGYLPTKSPLLAANLLVAFGELYSSTGPVTAAAVRTATPPLAETTTTAAVGGGVSGFHPPPIQVVRLAAAWLKDNPELCGGQGSTPHQGSLPITGRSPLLTGIPVTSVPDPTKRSGSGSLLKKIIYFK